MIDSTLILHALPTLLRGLIVSLEIAFSALCIGMLCGTLLGIGQTLGNSFMKGAIGIYVALIRGTPMLIQIVFLYYIVSITGIGLSPFATAVLAIGLNSSAYISQIMRAGIHAVPHGQREAAKTLGISSRDTILYIILPHAFRVVLPALGNESITLVKDSSLASLIGVMELYKEGQVVISNTYDALSTYCAIGALYLLVTTTLSFLVYRLEVFLNRHAQH
jgi:polar amino acid transport system permease protein